MSFDPITAIADTGKELLKKFVRDKASEAELKGLEIQADKIADDFELAIRRQSSDESSEFHKFVIDYAGSAQDYKTIPFFGPLMLLIRGCVRPALTFATAYWDWIFFTSDTSAWTTEKILLLGKINIIVLAFWFGDRIINSSGAANIIDKIFAKK